MMDQKQPEIRLSKKLMNLKREAERCEKWRDDMEEKKFSDWVKDAKDATEKKGLTVEKIAEEINVSTSYLHGIMSGRVFSRSMIQKVSEYLEIEWNVKNNREKSDWWKNANIAMLEKGINTNELADSIGLRREYVSAILNGRVVSKPAIQKISDFLNIACNALQ